MRRTLLALLTLALLAASGCIGKPPGTGRVNTTGAYGSPSSPSYQPSRGGPVHVRGYYRRDGTYVQPHTRRAPRRR